MDLDRWTNISFTAVAAYVLALGAYAHWWLASALATLTAGSWWYHAVDRRSKYENKWARLLDEIGMYGVYGVLAALAWRPVWWVYGGVWLLLAVLSPWLPSTYAVPILAAIGLVKLPLLGQWAALVGALAAYGVAYWFWRMAGPDSWQHALWHVFAAAGILVTYLGLI